METAVAKLEAQLSVCKTKVKQDKKVSAPKSEKRADKKSASLKLEKQAAAREDLKAKKAERVANDKSVKTGEASGTDIRSLLRRKMASMESPYKK
jgi:hypothetical protein